MAFLNALGGVFSLLLVVALGYFLARLGWFPPPCSQLLPKLVTNISLPPFLACTIISSFPKNNLGQMLTGALLPLISMIFLFALAYMTGKIMNVPKRHFGLFCVCISNPNTIFIGIPVNMALFGPESLPYVLLYYFASTSFFWTAGNYFVSRDAEASPGRCAPKQRRRRIHWQNIISPPMYGFLSGMAILWSGIEIPAFIFKSAMLVGGLTTPLALLFIGITIENIGLNRLRPTLDMVVALCGRLFASPLIMWLLLPLFNLPELMGKVFIIQSALPTIMSVAILSAYYNTDPDFGSIMVSLSTILCAITIPVLMAIL